MHRKKERKGRAESAASRPEPESTGGALRHPGEPDDSPPPVREGCGAGGGPVCWINRQSGGTGEEVDSYPTEDEALRVLDHSMSFDPEVIRGLTYDEWIMWLHNFLRVAYPGALTEGKGSAVELAAKWNGQAAVGSRWNRVTLVRDLTRTYPLAYTYWLAVIGKMSQSHKAITSEPGAGRTPAAEAADEGSARGSDPGKGHGTKGAEPPQDEWWMKGRRDKGSKGKDKKGKSNKGKGRWYDGKPASSEALRKPEPGSIPSELLKPGVCRLCYEEGHWGNQCPSYYPNGEPREVDDWYGSSSGREEPPSAKWGGKGEGGFDGKPDPSDL